MQWVFLLLVLYRVFFRAYKLQVFNSVVPLVVVDVMNELESAKAASECAFHNEAMLVNLTATDLPPLVWRHPITSRNAPMNATACGTQSELPAPLTWPTRLGSP